MFNARLSHLEVIGKALGLCKIPEDLALLRRRNILGRSEVILDKNDTMPVKDLSGSDLLEGLNCQRRRDVIPQGDVDPGIDELSR